MPSYADLNGTPTAPSPINAAYYSVDNPGPTVSILSPPQRTRGGGPPATTSSPLVSKMIKFTPQRTRAAAHKYEALANKELTVKLSALPAKLQPTLSEFDLEGEGFIDTAELGRAAQLYQQHKSRRGYEWIRALLLVACLLAGGFLVSISTIYVMQAKTQSEPVQMASSSGFQLTDAGVSFNRSISYAAASVNATSIPIESLLNVRPLVLHALSHLSLKLATDDGTSEDIFYTVTGFEKMGQQRLILWTNRPDEWVVVVPGRAYRIVAAQDSGVKPTAEDILGSNGGLIGVDSPDAAASAAMFSGHVSESDLWDDAVTHSEFPTAEFDITELYSYDHQADSSRRPSP
mmetsp:Transcript_31929/g.80667  ORF Transcript_31929/g.80667 Transcript_31929/m.80667 type:complete len:347 (+) Transcript_31929:463-1503(+)|eukprot:jgi/Tetstr1/434865/TSEL_002579.t1